MGSRTEKHDVAANFLANGWAAAIGIACVPIYIRLLGIEAYGLVGIYATLQAMVSILDLGLTATMNREMAALRGAQQLHKARDLVRTLELLYWAMGGMIGVAVMTLVPVLSHRWLTTVQLKAGTVEHTLYLIGAVMILQWPFSFYAGGLIGLQRQVELSVSSALIATVRAIGAIAVLLYVSRTVEAFFAWQVLISCTSTTAAAFLLWWYLPKQRGRARFRPAELVRVWRFAAGMSAVGLLSLGLLQTDKIVLSRVLTLDNFGYYTLAGTVSASLYMMINPVYNAIYPRITSAVAANDRHTESELYHRGSSLMSALILPATVVLALFSREVLIAWTGNVITADRTWLLITLLVIGSGLHGIAHIPWALQLAHGWTRLGFWVNAAEVIVLVPLCIVLSYEFGAVGGAITWILVNLGSLVASQYLMHRRLLRGELAQWYLRDIGRPAAGAFIAALTVRVLFPATTNRIALVCLLFITGIATLGVSAALTDDGRGWLVGRMRLLGLSSRAG